MTPSPKQVLSFCAALGAVALALPVSAMSGLVVHIDEGTPVHLSGTAAQVVVGNPSVADATIIDRHQLMLLGRGYGSTSLVVMDGAGRTIYSGLITVTSPTANHVSIYRGVALSNYACAGRCERSPLPGEPDTTYQPYATPFKDYGDRAKTAAGGSGNP